MSLPFQSIRRNIFVCVWVLICSSLWFAEAQESTKVNLESSVLNAQQQFSWDNNAHSIHALRLTDGIKIDGKLDEPVWSQAEAATDFRQQEPNEGSPATEKTEVRLLFDEKNIYIGIHAFDSEPSHINARELVRDAEFPNDDKIAIVLDTYHDRRNAYRFTVNPR